MFLPTKTTITTTKQEGERERLPQFNRKRVCSVGLLQDPNTKRFKRTLIYFDTSTSSHSVSDFCRSVNTEGCEVGIAGWVWRLVKVTLCAEDGEGCDLIGAVVQ